MRNIWEEEYPIPRDPNDEFIKLDEMPDDDSFRDDLDLVFAGVLDDDSDIPSLKVDYPVGVSFREIYGRLHAEFALLCNIPVSREDEKYIHSFANMVFKGECTATQSIREIQRYAKSINESIYELLNIPRGNSNYAKNKKPNATARESDYTENQAKEKRQRDIRKLRQQRAAEKAKLLKPESHIYESEDSDRLTNLLADMDLEDGRETRRKLREIFLERNINPDEDSDIKELIEHVGALVDNGEMHFQQTRKLLLHYLRTFHYLIFSSKLNPLYSC